ncbi:MAG: hypothetical protein OQL19_08860 [Gammaproteobacteria bacterium]|nr:hypothetical protein [Gammaproteobacteria bacterium]
MIFKYSQLKKFLIQLKKTGSIELFKDWKGDRVFLLRHDVDFDLQLAYDLAKIENKIGINSTFFILTTCPSYNILCERSRYLLKEIIKMGHEIALHFDPTLYEENTLESAVDREAEILSFASGQPVKSISLHNPSVHGFYPIFEKYINAYDPNIFSDNNYISDSCFNFRNKKPLEFIKNIDKSMIQILLHPLHYSENGDGYDIIFTNSYQRMMNEINKNFSVNATYREQVGDNLVTTFISNSQ